MDNRQIGRALREISLFLEMDGVPFKPRAFEKAALAIEALDHPVEKVWQGGGPKALQEKATTGRRRAVAHA